MRLLVTGANGFVGSHVADRLAAQGHELRLLLRRTSLIENIVRLAYERHDGDLRVPESLADAVRGVEVVVHIGGVTAARTEAEYMAANGRGTESLVKAAVRAGVRRFVYVSSLAAHGPSPDGAPRPLDAPGRPLSSYGRSKLAGEVATLAAREQMSVAVVRPPAVYGPRDKALLPLYKIARTGVLPVIGDGRNVVSFVHVHDMADAIVAVALAEGPSGGIYTAEDGTPHTWREMVRAYGDAIGKRVLCVPTPVALYAGAGYATGVVSWLLRRPLPLSPEEVKSMRQRHWVCDSAAMTRDFGWRPTIGIEEGMRTTAAWCKERGWL
jgi:nucleoside-diphosphate-sugar epimerase